MLPDTPIVLRRPQDEKEFLEVPTVLSPLGEISKGIQNLPLKESVEQFRRFFTSLNDEMPQVKKMINSMSRVVDGNAGAAADTLDNFNKAAVNISQAAKALRNFADYIERHPEALLKGKK